MAAITGKDGDVIKDGVQVCESTKWSISLTANNPAYGSNCSSGTKRRAVGVTDSKGSVDFKWDPGRPMYGTGTGQIKEGTAITLYLYLDDNQYFDVPAVVDEVSFEVDMDNGELIGGSFSWSQRDGVTANLAEESSNSSSSSSSSS